MRENNAAMPDDTSANDNVSPARPEPTAFVPTPFDEVIDISDLVAERRRLQRNLWAMHIITIVLLIAAIAVACFPLALQFESDRNLGHHSQRSSRLALPAGERQAHGGPRIQQEAR